MSERSIEVPDPDPVAPGAAAPQSPYKNLLVPLVVVPFLVVGVLVLVYVFFGAIAGKEAGLEDNLARVVDGGPNEAKQAAMNLGTQAAENARAKLEGKPEPWPTGADFPERLAQAWNKLNADDVRLRLAVAQLSAAYGDASAVEKLGTFLALPDEKDREGDLRFAALMALTWLDEPRSAALVIPFLHHADPLLRQVAAGVLQKMPGEATTAALAGPPRSAATFRAASRLGAISVRTTRQPFSTRQRAMPVPIRLAPPVMTATLTAALAGAARSLRPAGGRGGASESTRDRGRRRRRRGFPNPARACLPSRERDECCPSCRCRRTSDA